jgi:hypothetical protein
MGGAMRAFLLAVSSLICLAGTPAQGECIGVGELFFEKLPSISEHWRAWQLRKNGEVWHLIFHNPKRHGDEWVLASRFSDDRPDIYCIRGEGTGILTLKALDDAKFTERFGLPGSGYPRCSEKDDPLGGLKVRAWAHEELGNTFILSFQDNIKKGHGFTLAMGSIDNSWILISQTEDVTSCYLDRGLSYDFDPNYTVRAKDQ